MRGAPAQQSGLQSNGRDQSHHWITPLQDLEALQAGLRVQLGSHKEGEALNQPNANSQVRNSLLKSRHAGTADIIMIVIGKHKIFSLAYADDKVLLADRKDMNEMLYRYTKKRPHG